MRRGLVWTGFGLFLVLGVGAGYVPEFRLRQEIEAAREEGTLLFPTTRAAAGDDAAPLYRAAVGRRPRIPRNLATPNLRQPEVRAYLLEIADASRRPAYIASEGPPDDLDGRLQTAAHWIAAAPRLGGPVAAARIARHLGSGAGFKAAYWWTVVAQDALIDADRLRLPKGPVVAALGPPPEPARLLRERFGTLVRWLERDGAPGREMGGPVGLFGTRAKIAIVRRWRAFLHGAPIDSTALAAVLRRKENGLNEGLAAFGVFDEFQAVNARTRPLTDLVQAIAETRRRL